MRAVGAPLSILTVCSGNLCRSPLAEQVLRARLAPSNRSFIVASAGTIAEDGAPMDATAAAQSREHGGDPDGHVSRLLKAGMVAQADLVLTATRAHRAAVVQMLPRASRYTFTLREITRLLGAVSPADRAAWTDLTDVVASAAAARGLAVPPDDESDDDIVDPYRREVAVHERAAAEIERAVTALVEAFRDVPARGGPDTGSVGETTGQVGE